jgi:MYXO-CTERM domain-containing protein
MKATRSLTSILFLILSALYSPTASAIVAAFVGDDTAHPGETATIEVELVTHEDLTDFSVVVEYDPGLFSITGVTAGSLLDEWGDDGLEWTDDPEAGFLTLTGSAHGLPPISWTSGRMVDIDFTVDPGAAFGTSPITLDTALFYSGDGAELLSFLENGEITVTDPDAPPPPEPVTLTLEIPDMTVTPGESVMVEVNLSGDVPTVVLAFTLWVDPTVITVDADREAEIAERAASATLTSTPLSESAQQYAIGTSSVDGPWIEAGDGWLVRLPYTVSPAAEPGLRSIMVTSTDAFVMVDGVLTNVDVEGLSGTLTITGSDPVDTGDPTVVDDTGTADDTGTTEDTGTPEDDPIDPADTGDAPLDTGGPEDAETGGDGTVSGTDTADDAKSGCGCTQGPTHRGLWAVLIAGLVGGLRRRPRRWVADPRIG